MKGELNSPIVIIRNMITYESVIPPQNCAKGAKSFRKTVNKGGNTHKLLKGTEKLFKIELRERHWIAKARLKAKTRDKVKAPSMNTCESYFQSKPENKF